jgi:uncharacterized protein YecT (DUF1311 family)
MTRPAASSSRPRSRARSRALDRLRGTRCGLFAALLVGLLATAEGASAALPTPIDLVFPAGTTGTVVYGAVARGEQAFYRFRAGVGQEVHFALLATESNAVAQIYGPDARLVESDGMVEVRGAALPGVGPGDDMAEWRGFLPATGSYLLVVGATRGGAEYQLSLEIASSVEGCAGVEQQQPMNECWGRLAKAVEAERVNAAAALADRVTPERQAALRAAEEAFTRYRDAHCTFVADAYRGGSLQLTAAASCRAELERQREQALRSLWADSQP